MGNRDKLACNVAKALTGDSSDHYDFLRDLLEELVTEDEWENLSYEDIYEIYERKVYGTEESNDG